MTTQWGAPLTGAQMKLLRLVEGDRYEWLWEGKWVDGSVAAFPNDYAQDFSYRLPADHIAYTLLEKGWLDGRNVALWFGGDKAPDDWLGGSDVLLSSGRTCGASLVHNWKDFGGIIAYIAKAEGMTTHDDRVLADAERAAKRVGGVFVKSEGWEKAFVKDETRQLNFTGECDADAARFVIENCTLISREGETWIDDMYRGRPFTLRGYRIEPIEADTVTIAKMTETEWVRLIGRGGYDILIILDELGLIKPEPTREDRFWSTQPNGGAHVTDDVKALVSEALNFERGK